MLKTSFYLYEDRKHAYISSGSSCLINYERRTTFALIALITTTRSVIPSPASVSSLERYATLHNMMNVYLKRVRISVSNFEIYFCLLNCVLWTSHYCSICSLLYER